MKNGLHNGIRSACLIELVCFALIALLLSQCACGIQTQLPVEPAVAAMPPQVVKNPAVIYTATQAELIREVCPTIDTVNLRQGAGTGFESKAVLSAGDRLTLTGELVIAPDMGLWWPVRSGSLDGFINARYVCE